MSKWHVYNNPDFRSPCCGNCIHVYDESSITACMLHDWVRVEFDQTCEDFDGGETNVG